MSENEEPSESDSSNAAQLFTNNAALAVFADRPFMTLMSYAESAAIIGKRLDTVLGIEEGVARQLFDELRSAANLDERLLDVHDANGIALRLICSGAATIDAGGKFLGADFRLRPPSVFADDIDVTIPHLRIDEDPTVDKMFLQLYFTTRLKALYVLMGRLVGPQVNDRLDKLVNDTAQRHKWDVSIAGGLFVGDIGTTPVEVYKILLHDTQAYAENMIGERLVVRELGNVKSQLHQGVLSLASRYGLYEPDKDQ